ncbi:MAG: type Z 30S ribosomal protein S14 [bacterium]
MARKAMIEKSKRIPKFKVRIHNRCLICGRPRGYLRKFGMCRICLRTLGREGKIPGLIKSSW